MHFFLCYVTVYSYVGMASISTSSIVGLCGQLIPFPSMIKCLDFCWMVLWDIMFLFCNRFLGLDMRSGCFLGCFWFLWRNNNTSFLPTASSCVVATKCWASQWKMLREMEWWKWWRLKKDGDEMDKRDDGIPPKLKNFMCSWKNKEGKKRVARKIFSNTSSSSILRVID